MANSSTPGNPPRPSSRAIPGATTAKPANTRSKGEAAGAQLVDTLNSLVEDLIRENRRLQRQVDKLTAGGGGPAAAGFERGLKAIQKRIEKTLAGAASSTATTRRKTPARPPTAPARGRRKPQSPAG